MAKKKQSKMFVTMRYDRETEQTYIVTWATDFQSAFDDAEEGDEVYEVVAVHEAARNLKSVKRDLKDFTG